MNAKALWIRLQREGFAVKPGDQPGSLKVTPRTKVGPELEALIVRYKPELLALAGMVDTPIPIDRTPDVMVDAPSGDRDYRWTPIPDDLLTEWAPVLTHAELRVILHLCRMVYGPDRLDGMRLWSHHELEAALSLPRRTIYDAIAGLDRVGLIEKEMVSGRRVCRVRLAPQQAREARRSL